MHNETVNVPVANATALDYYDYLEDWEEVGHSGALHYTTMVVLGLVVFVGGFFNISSIVILIRHRMWMLNEGYVHLLTVLVGNLVIILIVDFPHWLSLFRESFHIGLSSNAVCEIWHFLAYVVFSTGWFVAALLLGVFLRLLMKQGLESRCCRVLAARYCTLTVSKVIVGAISGSFAVLNVWQLWTVQLIEVSVGGEHYRRFCEVSHDWYERLYVWELTSLCIIWYLPVLVVVPLLLLAILWCSRRSDIAGFSFRSMSVDTEDAGSDEADLRRTALLVGLSVFLLQTPIIIVYIYLIAADYHENLVVAYGIAHILATTHLLVVPILCLATNARMRKEIRSAAAAGKCCPWREDDDSVDGGVLPMDLVTQLQQPTLIRTV